MGPCYVRPLFRFRRRWGKSATSGDPLRLAPTRLTTSSAGQQWFETGGIVRVELAETTQFGQNINLTAGTFFLDGPMFSASVLTFGGTLMIGSTASLGGNGLVVGHLHVLSDGQIDMGFSDTGTGSLLVTGDVILDNDASLIIDINPPYALPGSDYDQLVVGGNLILSTPTLVLNGAEQLSTTVGEIVLVELFFPTSTRFGSFDPNEGALSIENGVLQAEVGLFRGQLLYTGGDGNDIVLSHVSFVPPILPATVLLPPLRIPVFTRTDLPLPVVQAPPLLAAASIPPLIEPEVTPVGLRYIEIRIVIPIDEAGNVREEFAMKLPAEWLANLPAVLRRLPDDRYRIYLMLEGGNEERLVMDVFVRDGRPIEPADTQEELALPLPDELPAGPNAADGANAARSKLCRRCRRRRTARIPVATHRKW